MHHQAHGYFGLLGIVNVGSNVLTNPLIVSDLHNLSGSAPQVQNLYDRVRSYMITKAINGSIINTYIKKIKVHWGEYELSDNGGIIRNNGPTMIYLLFKSINRDTRIGVYDLNYEIEKETITKFGNNITDFLDEMYSS